MANRKIYIFMTDEKDNFVPVKAQRIFCVLPLDPPIQSKKINERKYKVF